MKHRLKSLWYKIHDNYLQKRKLRFISWFHSKFPDKYCWTDCVSWAYSPYSFNPFSIMTSEGCEIESREHYSGGCYCGQWQDGKCWSKLSKAEQDEIRKVQNE